MSLTCFVTRIYQQRKRSQCSSVLLLPKRRRPAIAADIYMVSTLSRRRRDGRDNTLALCYSPSNQIEFHVTRWVLFLHTVNYQKYNRANPSFELMKRLNKYHVVN